MRRLIGMVIASLLASATAYATEPQRLALVIGNSDYNADGRIALDKAAQDEAAAMGLPPDLANSVKDAVSVRDALASMSYAVDFTSDADLAAMRAAITAFREKAARAPADSRIVIYYAGHGVNVAGVTYLVPVSTRVPQVLPQAKNPNVQMLNPQRTRAAMAAVAAPLNDLLTGLGNRRDGGFILVLLDNCRDNPWAAPIPEKGDRTFALVRKLVDEGVNNFEIPTVTLVGLSAGDGERAFDGAADHSPFTAALLDVITRPDLTVSQMWDAVAKKVKADTNGDQVPQTYPFNLLINTTCVPGCSAAARLSSETKRKYSQ